MDKFAGVVEGKDKQRHSGNGADCPGQVQGHGRADGEGGVRWMN